MCLTKGRGGIVEISLSLAVEFSSVVASVALLSTSCSTLLFLACTSGGNGGLVLFSSRVMYRDKSICFMESTFVPGSIEFSMGANRRIAHSYVEASFMTIGSGR